MIKFLFPAHSLYANVMFYTYYDLYSRSIHLNWYDKIHLLYTGVIIPHKNSLNSVGVKVTQGMLNNICRTGSVPLPRYCRGSPAWHKYSWSLLQGQTYQLSSSSSLTWGLASTSGCLVLAGQAGLPWSSGRRNPRGQGQTHSWCTAGSCRLLTWGPC